MKKVVRRIQKMAEVPNDFAFLRLCELVKATLEPPEKNGHAAERSPLAQIIVNDTPSRRPVKSPSPPAPTTRKGGQAFTAVDPP